MSDGPDFASIASDFLSGLTVVPAGDDEFTAITPDWHGDPLFGGTIVGLAMSAAVQTSEDDRRAHSFHGMFLRPVRTGEPPRLRVERIRDGRMFSTRRVRIEQDGKLAFEAVVSFHTEETELPEYGRRLDPSVPRPGDLPLEPDPEWGPGPFEMRHLGPTEPDGDGHRDSTTRYWFRLRPPGNDDPGLDAVAFAYASDMTQTSGRPHRLEGDVTGMISLDHALWLHRPARIDQWHYYDCHALVSAGGRSLVRVTMHDVEGRLVASLAQEMVILIP